MNPPRKPPEKMNARDAKAARDSTFAPPTPKVSRQQRGKVLSPAERAAFLASRPDLKPR